MYVHYRKVGEWSTAVYVDLSRVTAWQPKTMASVGAAIAGNFRTALTKTNNVDFYAFREDITTNDWDIDWDDVIREIAELPTTKITQFHHVHIRVKELKAMIDALDDDQYEGLRYGVIRALLKKKRKLGVDNKVSSITFATYCLVAPPFAVVHLGRLIEEANDYNYFNRLLKAESGAAKQLQTYYRDDLAKVYELNVLYNRLFDNVDWEDEREKRQEVKAVPISSQRVYEISREIFGDALNEGKKAMYYEWDSYWKVRWSRMPSGSIVSQYEEDKAIKKSLPMEAKVKSAWFSAINDNSYERWSSRKPEIFASTSTKYEWGKVRALYGCDVTSFLHSDFGMPNCEDMLPSYFPVGSAANDDNIRQAMMTFVDTVPVCFDYDDFNSQHSNSSMRAVLTAWRDTFKHQLSDKQVTSVDWTINSIDDVSVFYGGLDKTHKINGTLMSGWRLTSFMNTVLNRVYLVAAGLKKNMVYALHNGDDMFGGARTVYEAVQLMRGADNIGVRAQVSKTNIGTIGEFLRVDTRAQDPTSAQYLSRSVATAVHGRYETHAPHDLCSLIAADVERASAIEVRGGRKSVCDALLKQQLKFVQELFEVDEAVVDAYFKLHPVQGGSNLKSDVTSVRLERMFASIDDNVYQLYDPIMPGTNDYVEYLVNKFDLPKTAVSKKRFFENAVKSLERRRVSYRTVAEDRIDIRNARGYYKVWSKTIFVPDIAKQRSLGLPVARVLHNVDGAAAWMVRHALSPELVLQYAF